MRCSYELDEWRFEERISVGAGLTWSPAAVEAARLVALLAGVSYYKAGAATVVDLGSMAVRPGEIEFLRSFYVDGLAEYAVRNHLSLADLSFVGGVPSPAGPAWTGPVDRPLIPFGGGLDSIVTVELLRSRYPAAALFVLNRQGDRFEAIETAAAVSGLPIVRAEREIDPQVLRSTENGFLNGHVPVTGVLSAIAVLAAVLDGRGAVVMSNEWSASSGNLVHEGLEVNHQFSKSLAFEEGFRSVLAGAIGGSFEYFSELRPYSELWIARQFAELTGYHGAFRSCNRAFQLDPARRATQWCGHCDKCCFIDLILSPFLSRAALGAIFGGREPLTDPALAGQFRTLVDLSGSAKPFECVGDAGECRAAVILAAARLDRAGDRVLQALATDVAAADVPDVGSLLGPMGPHHIPDAFLPAAPLG